jgi:hypothetical protein
MSALLAGLRRRPWRAVALVLAVAWIAVVTYESLTHVEYGASRWFYELTAIASGSFGGVASIAALSWLVERSRLFSGDA